MIKYYCEALIYALCDLKENKSLSTEILYYYRENKFADVSFETFEKI